MLLFVTVCETVQIFFTVCSHELTIDLCVVIILFCYWCCYDIQLYRYCDRCGNCLSKFKVSLHPSQPSDNSHSEQPPAPILQCLHAVMLQAVCCMACLSTIVISLKHHPKHVKHFSFSFLSKVLCQASVQGDPFLYLALLTGLISYNTTGSEK